MNQNTSRWLGGLVLLIYIAVGSLYAAFTPVWQAPDEPAHYNYIRSLATGEGFPLMEIGDYDQVYLSRLTSEGFPETLPVTPLEYEDHQPPLYYLLATPVFILSNGSTLVLRVYTVLLGALAVAMVMLITAELVPDRPGLAVFAGALLAFVPQFVGMSASINNDALTFALLWLWVWLALRYLRGDVKPWVLSLVMGFLLLTKSTGYSVIVLTGLVGLITWRKSGQPLKFMLREWTLLALPGLLIGALWWGRNSNVYGFPDIMGLQQHNAIVIGQPRTMDLINAQGWGPFLAGALRTTFQSFWGQFGWMGVVLDVRIYQGLALYSLLVLVASVYWFVAAAREKLAPYMRDGLCLLAALTLMTTGLFVFYNLSFVQHQGRYLFPGLPLLAAVTALGFSKLLERRAAVIAGAVFALLGVGLAALGLLAGEFPKWPLLMCAAFVVGVPVLSFVPDRWHPLLAGGLIGGAVLLDIVCLFGFIVPILA